ncbi:MAG: phosphodiester glycosidase family protein [Cyanobacteria bacterium P01_F01_bin.150]
MAKRQQQRQRQQQPKRLWSLGAIAFVSLTILVGLKLGQSHLGVLATAHRQSNRQVFSQTQHQAQDTTSLQVAQQIHHQFNRQGIRYETLTLPKSIVHVVRISAQAPVVIRPAIATEGLEKLEVLAQQAGAIAAINGGFFDPNNQLTTSYVTIDGDVALDPRENSGLMENFNVAIYIERILNRSEFRRYQCNTANGQEVNYAIALHDQLTPFSCELIDALGAGPALLPQFRGEEEAFVDAINGRDALGSNTPNARSAIGLTPDGTIIFAMAAQRADVSDRTGLSLFELADVMKSLGAEQALNLDGGSSSSLYYDGTTHYGRLDADNNVIKRSVKSVLLVVPRE